MLYVVIHEPIWSMVSKDMNARQKIVTRPILQSGLIHLWSQREAVKNILHKQLRVEGLTLSIH